MLHKMPIGDEGSAFSKADHCFWALASFLVGLVVKGRVFLFFGPVGWSPPWSAMTSCSFSKPYSCGAAKTFPSLVTRVPRLFQTLNTCRQVFAKTKSFPDLVFSKTGLFQDHQQLQLQAFAVFAVFVCVCLCGRCVATVCVCCLALSVGAVLHCVRCCACGVMHDM